MVYILFIMSQRDCYNRKNKLRDEDEGFPQSSQEPFLQKQQVGPACCYCHWGGRLQQPPGELLLPHQRPSSTPPHTDWTSHHPLQSPRWAPARMLLSARHVDVSACSSDATRINISFLSTLAAALAGLQLGIGSCQLLHLVQKAGCVPEEAIQV